jgi:hypothetical protein
MSNDPKYKIGDTAPGGSEIIQIYGQTETVLVYRTKSDSISHFVDEAELSAKNQAVLRRYDNIHTLGFQIFPKKSWNWLNDELASALYNGLSTSDAGQAAKSFDELEARIIARGKNSGRLCYLLSASSASLVFGLIALALFLWYPIEEHRLYAGCMLFAIGGAFASVIVRTSSVEVDPTERREIVVLRGVFRIVLGVLLAAFLIAAAKANLIAGIAVSTPWSFVAFSFLAGFSERFVPEILANFEQKSTKSSASKS